MIMKLYSKDIGRMLELSVVRTDCTTEKVHKLATEAKKYQAAIATTLPSHTKLLVDLLEDEPEVGISGNIGFPSGGSTTATKIAETKELKQMGCTEIDMMMDVGMHLSGNYRYVEDDIRSVIEAAAELPVKVILECFYLTNDQIRKACELCLKAGAAFIKTGTGWAPTGATLENISLIKSCVGDDIEIKASGGVRGLETLIEMYRRGARRFGIGLGKEKIILNQCDSLPGGLIEFPI